MKKPPVVVVLLVLLPVLIWGQFYQNLPQDKRRELAEAYYLVGTQYIQTGKEQKGRDFQEMAFLIDPRLEPEKIQLKDFATAEALIAGRQAAILQPYPQRTEDVLRSRFMRLAGAFLAGDTSTVLGLLDGSVYIDGAEVSRTRIGQELDRFFAGRNLQGLVPSEVYDIDSLTFTPNPAGSPAAWGETWRLTIRARRDFSGIIAFWKPEQQFWVHRRGNSWPIMGIGAMPPARWIPQEPKPLTPVPLEQAQASTREIQAAFLECLDYFLQKDPRAAREYLSPEVQILRLNTSLSRDDMIATFQGYFEAKDFSGITVKDVVDPASIVVESTDRLQDAPAGDVYLLTVKVRLDLSDRIPFWTRFQEYYFTRESGSWRIFAIF